jgi:hypothetical protein
MMGRKIVKLIFRTLVVLMGLCACFRPAKAQEVYTYLNFGVPHADSTHQQVDTYGDGNYYPTRSLGGVFGDFGVSAMLKKPIGVGFDIAWRLEHATYTGIQYRPVFYSFDAIFQPRRLTNSRLTTELRAGIGGTGLHYNPDEQQNCVNGPACENVSHFQAHSAVALRIYAGKHFFVRPAIDLHYVHNFVEFGSNWVPQYSVGIGWGLGRER